MQRGRAVYREESMYKPCIVSGHRVEPFLLGWSRISLVYWLSNHSICSFEVGTTGWSPSRKISDAASVSQWPLSTSDGQCSFKRSVVMSTSRFSHSLRSSALLSQITETHIHGVCFNFFSPVHPPSSPWSDESFLFFPEPRGWKGS